MIGTSSLDGKKYEEFVAPTFFDNILVESGRPNEHFEKPVATSAQPDGRLELNADTPEYRFVEAYIKQKPPHGVRIRRICRLVDQAAREKFERFVVRAEAQASAPCETFPNAQPMREAALKRCGAMQKAFNPFQLALSDKIKQFASIKILPLWHQTAEDLMRYGRGNYFSTSARHAASASPKEICLSWVAMDQVYPVVPDCPAGRSSDEILLQQSAAYENYDTYFVPSVDDGHPCFPGWSPSHDQFVVRDLAQALPAYSVEFEPIAVQELSYSSEEAAFRAAKEGDLAFLQEWVRADSTRLRTLGPNGETLFHYAAQGGQRIIMQWLFDQDSTLVNVCTAFGESPLYFAVLFGDAEGVRWIYEKCPSQIDTTINGWNLPHFAAYFGHLDVLEFLLKQKSELSEGVTHEGWDLSYAAARGGRVEILKYLSRSQQKGPGLAFDGSSPLHAAAFSNHREAFICLESLNVNLIKAADKQGNTVLHTAILGNASEVISYILQKHPALLHTVNGKGMSPIHLAAAQGNEAALDLLLEFMKTTSSAGKIKRDLPRQFLLRHPLTVRDRMERTPLEVAILCNREGCVRKLLDRQEVDPFGLNSRKQNSLHFCVVEDRLGPFSEILQQTSGKAGFKDAIGGRDAHGKTVSGLAACRPFGAPFLTLLLENGVDPNERDRQLNTLLHLAAINGQLESVKALLKAGANRFSRNQAGQTPIDCAIASNHHAVARLLIDPDCSDSCVKDHTPEVDLEGYFYQQLELAYTEARAADQIFCLQALSHLYREKSQLRMASHLINAALNAAIEYGFPEDYQSYLIDCLEALERDYIREELSHSNISLEYKGHVRFYRKKLISLRKQIRDQLQANVSPEEIQKNLTKSFQQILQNILSRCEKVLGPPPTAYAVIGLGSMARWEMSPFSDVELAILIEQSSEPIKTYFRRLSGLLELILIDLGETDIPLIRERRIGGEKLPEKSFTPSGFKMDTGGTSPKGKEGIYELIGTPKELGIFQTEEWLAQNSSEIILVNTMRCACLVAGSEHLLEAYRDVVASHLYNRPSSSSNKPADKLRQFPSFLGKSSRKLPFLAEQTTISLRAKDRAFSMLRGHLEEFKPYLKQGRVDDTAFNVKKDLYRPLQMVLESLSLYFGIDAPTSIGRIEALKEKGVLSPIGAENLKKALQIVAKMRLEVQLFYGGEEENLVYCRDQRDEGLCPLTPERMEQILNVYRVQFPLNQAAQRFLEGDEKAFQSNNFYDSSIGGQTEDLSLAIPQTLLKEEEALWQVASLRPEDPQSMMNLANLKIQTGGVSKSLEYSLRALALHKRNSNVQPSDVARALSAIANAYVELGCHELALKCREEALVAVANFQQSALDDPQFQFTLLLKLEDFEQMATLLSDLGSSYRCLGNWQRALNFCQRSLSLFEEWNKQHVKALPQGYGHALNNMGCLLQESNAPETAIGYHLQALSFFSGSVSAANHPFIAFTLLQLATASKRVGKLDEAIDYAQKALTMCRALYKGAIHPRIGDCLFLMATIYAEQQNADLALQLHQEALNNRLQVHQDTPHWDTATSLNHLGFIYRSLGQKKQAIGCWSRTLAIGKALQDKPSVFLAKLLSRLFETCEELGDEDQAVAYLTECVSTLKQLREGKLGDPDFASQLSRAQSTLGGIYKKRKQFELALHEFQDVLTVLEDVHGPAPHLDKVMCLGELSKIFMGLNRYDEAITSGCEAWAIYEQLNAPKPFETMHVFLANLGAALRLRGDFSESLRYSERALSIQRELIQKDDEETASILNNMGATYRKLNDFKKAIALYEQALAVYQDLHPDGHVQVPNILNNIAVCQYTAGDLGAAIATYEKAIQIAETLFKGTPHSVWAACIDGLALVYTMQGQFKEATECRERALAMRRQVFRNGPHPELALSLNNVGDSYQREGDFERAIALFHESLAIYLQLYKNKSHLETVTPLYNLARSYQFLGKWTQFVDHCVLAFQMSRHFPQTKLHESVLSMMGEGIMILRKAAEAAESSEKLEDAIMLRRCQLALTRELCNHEPSEAIVDLLELLGEHHLSIDQVVEASKYWKERLDMLRKLLRDSPTSELAAAYSDLGISCSRSGQLQEAIEHHEFALKIRLQLANDGPNEDVALSLNCLGNACVRTGDFKRAIDCLERALAMRRIIFGHSPNVAIVRTLTSFAAIPDMDLEQKLQHANEAVEMCTQLFGEEPTTIAAQALGNLAHVFCELEQFDKAIEGFHLCLKMEKAVRGQQPSLTTARFLSSLGACYVYKKQPKLALEYIGEALKMDMEIFGDNSTPFRAQIYHNLGMAFEADGNLKRAKECFQLAERK